MTGGRQISAVGVVIPARDEEDTIGRCLRSVRAALERLPVGVATSVTVVLDRCTDRTPDRVVGLLEGWPEAAALRVAALGGRRAGTAHGPGPAHIVAGSGIGAVRDLGVRAVLADMASHSLPAVWLLHTDADTTVPPDWAIAHLQHAEAGACGVAGMADLEAPAHLTPPVRRRYRAIVRAGVRGDRHLHVYGANLGVRADAYLAVGGFPPDGPGEDHGLWSRLGASGYPLVQPTAVRVRTSARVLGRATGGLADLLRGLDDEPAASGDDCPSPMADPRP